MGILRSKTQDNILSDQREKKKQNETRKRDERLVRSVLLKEWNAIVKWIQITYIIAVIKFAKFAPTQ